MHIVDCTTISMVDGDLIWESCISDDQQDFNHTRCEYSVNIVGSMCDTIDHKALLVTTEPCCYFGVWRGIQCVWTTLWSRRHLAGSHFLPESPFTEWCAQGSLLQFDWPQNLALSNLFSLSFFSFSSNLSTFLNLHSLTNVSVSVRYHNQAKARISALQNMSQFSPKCKLYQAKDVLVNLPSAEKNFQPLDPLSSTNSKAVVFPAHCTHCTLEKVFLWTRMAPPTSMTITYNHNNDDDFEKNVVSVP